MNYQEYKTRFPNAVKEFFNWLSKAEIEDVENINSISRDLRCHFLNDYGFSVGLTEKPELHFFEYTTDIHGSIYGFISDNNIDYQHYYCSEEKLYIQSFQILELYLQKK